MSETKITAVIRQCVQVSPDDFEMRAITRNFSVNRPIKDILEWAESEGVEKPTINDFMLCEYRGSGI